MPDDKTLPEGTDSIIDGGGDVDRDSIADKTGPLLDDTDLGGPKSGAASSGGSANFSADGIRAAFFDKLGGLRGEATERAFAYAETGRDRATGALDDVAQLIEEAAREIDEKLGAQYGDYARRAAEGIGSFSDGFRDKSAEELFDDAKALVQKSPAIAVGAAAAIGFVVARFVRAGLSDAGTRTGGDASAA